MKRRFNCMHLLPPELTGVSCDTCLMFRDFVCTHSESCAGRRKHTRESRQALAEAIEIRRAERGERFPVDTARGVMIQYAPS